MPTEESTEKQILESAYRLFVENGFAGSSMRDIAEYAGIKAASIYNHYKNKDQIFEAVFIEKHPIFRILEVIDNAKGDNAEELIIDAVDCLHEEINSHPKLLNLFFVELVEMNGKHVEKAMKTNFPPDSRFIRQIYAKKSEIRRIPIPVLLRTIVETVFANLIFSWFVGQSNIERYGTRDQMIDVLLRGILR